MKVVLVQVGVQARPMIQPKPSAGGQPTMVVTPKFQQTGSQPDVRPVNILPKPVSLAVSVAGQSQPILTTSNGAVCTANSLYKLPLRSTFVTLSFTIQQYVLVPLIPCRRLRRRPWVCNVMC